MRTSDVTLSYIACRSFSIHGRPISVKYSSDDDDDA